MTSKIGSGTVELGPSKFETVVELVPQGWPEALAFLTSPGALPLDVYALGAIVRACEQQGQWLSALEAIDVARQRSVQAGWVGGVMNLHINNFRIL